MKTTKTLALNDIERGYLLMLVRMDRTRLVKKRERLMERFGAEVDLAAVVAKMVANMSLTDRLRRLDSCES